MPQTFSFLLGDALDTLRTLPDESANSIVTSPPYFGLRDYQADGQIGREKTPGAFIAALVAVFREARRVLRKDGTFWLNIGDTYANKQLLGIPWRLAMALQDDGWWLRAEQVWDKPNAAPESCRDRPSRSHEYVFLLTRSRRYHYDADAVRTPNTSELSGTRKAQLESGDATVTPSGSVRFRVGGKWGSCQSVRGGFVSYNPKGRNLRSVWRVPTKAFFPKSVGVTDVDHFAVMSPDIARLCIRAGCPAGGVVLDPFGGAGTTLAVAKAEGRSGVYIDLNPDYLRLAEARVAYVTTS